MRKFFLMDSAKGRYGHSMTRLGSSIYIMGGKDQKGQLLNDMWKFDLENVQWSEKK